MGGGGTFNVLICYKGVVLHVQRCIIKKTYTEHKDKDKHILNLSTRQK